MIFDGAWSIVEMRGPSVVSFIFILVLSAVCYLQHRQINGLTDKLEVAKTGIYESLGEDISEIRVDVGKQAESSKSICVSLDDMKKDIRQMREFHNRK